MFGIRYSPIIHTYIIIIIVQNNPWNNNLYVQDSYFSCFKIWKVSRLQKYPGEPARVWGNILWTIILYLISNITNCKYSLLFCPAKTCLRIFFFLRNSFAKKKKNFNTCVFPAKTRLRVFASNLRVFASFCMLLFRTNIKSPFLGFSIVFYFFRFLRFFYFFRFLRFFYFFRIFWFFWWGVQGQFCWIL